MAYAYPPGRVSPPQGDIGTQDVFGRSVAEQAEEDEADDHRRRLQHAASRESERYRQPHPDIVLPQRVESAAGETSTQGGSSQRNRKRDTLDDRIDRLSQLGATLGALVFFSIWGVLGRLGTTALGTFSGAPVFGLIWAQSIACAVMGTLVDNKTELESFLPLYIGLTTGFCGAMTTFSGFALSVFQGFANTGSSPRGRLYDAIDGLSYTALTLGMTTAALRFGIHASDLFMRTLRLGRLGLSAQPTRERLHLVSKSGSLERPARPRLFNLLLLGLGLASWIGAALVAGLGPPSWRGRATFAIVFGPLGTILRWYLSRLNPLWTSFPIGTFAANMLGTALIGVFVLLQRKGNVINGTTSCDVLQGLDDGFNGCLTTISTFAVELRGLRRSHAYIYATASWVLSQVILVLVYGVPMWSSGVSVVCHV